MHIRKAIQEDKSQISKIRPAVYKNMVESGLHQWGEDYPTDAILFADIDKGNMLVALIDSAVAGYVTVNDDLPKEYSSVDLQFAPRLCVHRLSVNPEFSKMGVGTQLMEFIHEYYKKQGHASICLDTSNENTPALNLYKKLGYTVRGYVHFEQRPQYTFPVMERLL